MDEIIDIIDGKYKLNTERLHSTLTLAKDCDKIAIISIVGPKSQGKTFFINCLVNYMNSEHKDEWPNSEDAEVNINSKLVNENNDSKPIIKLTSKPFIITENIDNEVERTAVFLMDSDFVFDYEMSSQREEDILSLFLATSSTIIYNRRLFLPNQEFSRLEVILSRFSARDTSIKFSKDVWFLIRDWSPEVRSNQFGFGLTGGSKYIQTLIENMELNPDYHDLNCCLLANPEINTNSNTVKLSELNKQFLFDLRNLMDYKLLNIEEMQKKRKPNTTEYINANELFELFETCITKLNGDADNNLVIDGLTDEFKNLTIEEKSRDKTQMDDDLISFNEDSSKFTMESHSNFDANTSKSDENDSNEKSTATQNHMNQNFSINELLFGEHCHASLNGTGTQISLESDVSCTNNKVTNEEHSESGFLKIEEKQYIICLNESQESGSIGKDLDDPTHDTSSDIIPCSSSSESAEETYDHKNDETFAEISLKELLSEDDESISFEGQNISYIDDDSVDSSNLPQTENVIKTQDSCARKSNANMNKSEERLQAASKRSLCVKSLVVDKANVWQSKTKSSKDLRDSCQSSHQEIEAQRSLSLINPRNEKIESLHSMPHSSHSDNNTEKVNENYNSVVIGAEIDETPEEISIENYFEDLIDNLSVEYSNEMEVELKDQNLDLDNYLNRTHNCIKQRIFETFKSNSNEIKPKTFVPEDKQKYYHILGEKMENNFKSFEERVKVILNDARVQYQEVLRRTIMLYEMSIKESITDGIRNLHEMRFSNICEVNTEKVLRIFKEETVQFHKGNIEKEFSKKLDDAVIATNTKYKVLLDHFRAYESKRKGNLPNNSFFSVYLAQEFHKTEKLRIVDSMKQFEDPELTRFSASLIEKLFSELEQHNISHIDDDPGYSSDLLKVKNVIEVKDSCAQKLNKDEKNNRERLQKNLGKSTCVENLVVDTDNIRQSEIKYRESFKGSHQNSHQDIRTHGSLLLANSRIQKDESLYPTLYSLHSNNKKVNKSSVAINVEIDEEFEKISSENCFKDLVDKLLIEYNNEMEVKLKDQNLDLDNYLRRTHNSIKLKIFETFKSNSNEIKPEKFIPKHKVKYYTILEENLEKNFKSFEEKVKVILGEALIQYQEVLRKIIMLYEMNMKESFKAGLRNFLHEKSFSNICEMNKKKVLKTFKEETVKFYKGNIEKELLTKFDNSINAANAKYKVLLDNFRAYESKIKETFPNHRYFSEYSIQEFHKREISKANYSMKQFGDPELTQLLLSSIEKLFGELEEQNKSIAKKEGDFAIRAIELAFQLYSDCFESKLKTGFFEPIDVNDIHDKLLNYTLRVLIDSCGFNEHQNYLVENCEQGLILKVEQMHEKRMNEYQKKIETSRNSLDIARKNAIKRYCNEMSAKLSKNTYLKYNEFTDSHHECNKIAIETFNKLADFLKQDFDTEFANKKIADNQSIIRKCIASEKDKFKLQNDKNTPIIPSMAIYLGHQYLIAATYRNNKFEMIVDKFNEKLRSNSISFGNEILFGNEAKNHYEKLFPNLDSFKNFDIKRLFGRERTQVSNEEIGEYPFTFLKDKMSVLVNYDDLNIDLSVESLLALMILDIKSCAEKQIGNKVSNIVLTVPSNCTINQKIAIRNAAKIAGLEDIDIISEISAAAISYATEKLRYFKKFADTVLFVIVNNYECDVAICKITNKNITYDVFFHKNLNSTEEEKKNFITKLFKSKATVEKLPKLSSKSSTTDLTMLKFRELFSSVFKATSLKAVHIDECVIAGNSELIPLIKSWIDRFVCPIPSMISNCFDTITNGSTIYGEMLLNRIDFIEIFEVTTHPFYFTFETKHLTGKRAQVFSQNILLPSENQKTRYNVPLSYELPIKIDVFQDDHLVSTNLIENLPISDYSRHEWQKHILHFDVDLRGQISVMSYITNKAETSGIKLDFIVSKPGLNDKSIGEEKSKLNALVQKMKNKKMFEEKMVSLELARSELSSFCMKVRGDVEKNQELRPLIKKQIYSELDNALKVIGSDNLDLKAIDNQKVLLNKALKGYNIL